MSEYKGAKLNQLQQDVPEGMLVDAAWLSRHGYPPNLRNRYVQSGWLEPIAYGVYRRPPSRLRATLPGQIPWPVVVASLQTLLGWAGTVGGATALGLEGYAHYLEPEGPRLVHLYGQGAPPAWLQRLELREVFVFHRKTRLFPLDKSDRSGDAVAVDVASGVSMPLPKYTASEPPAAPWSPTSWPIVCSAPERAVLEMLDELPERESFERVDKVFESLAGLNPRTCQRLLEACSNVKVKRLFLWFADRHRHRWGERLDRSRVDLGSGKRVIAKQGCLNKTYQITVPPDLDGAV